MKKTLERLAGVVAPSPPKPTIDERGNLLSPAEADKVPAEALSAQEKEKMEQRIAKTKDILDFIRNHFLEVQ